MAGLLEAIRAKLNKKSAMGVSRVTTATTATSVTGTTSGTTSSERKQMTVSKDDFLLDQIDEFRQKAEQLQKLLNNREAKAMELQTVVEEREGKAEELGAILKARQEKADGITAEVEQKIDALIEKVTAKMDEISSTMTSELQEGRAENAQQVKELSDTLLQVNTQLEGLKADLSDKIHTENVKCYRNIQDLFKGIDDKVERIAYVEKKVKGVKGIAITMLVFSSINLVGLLVLILNAFGIFQMMF